MPAPWRAASRDWELTAAMVNQLGPAEVAEVNGNVVAHGDDDALDVLCLGVLAHRAHDVAALALVEVAAAVVAILPFERGAQRVERHPPRRQLGRVDQHVHLALATAVDVRGGHARHALQLRLDEVVEEIEVGPGFAREALRVQRLDRLDGQAAEEERARCTRDTSWIPAHCKDAGDQKIGDDRHGWFTCVPNFIRNTWWPDGGNH